MRRISLAFILVLVFPALAAGAAHDVKLSLVAYSTPRERLRSAHPCLPEDAGRKRGVLLAVLRQLG